MLEFSCYEFRMRGLWALIGFGLTATGCDAFSADTEVPTPTDGLSTPSGVVPAEGAVPAGVAGAAGVEPSVARTTGVPVRQETPPESPAIGSLLGGTPVDLGTVVSDARAVPILGGTLLATRDGRHAVVSDPDRDSVFIVDLETQDIAHTVTTSPGDQPARAVEDESGAVHVVLRHAGAVLGIDVETGETLYQSTVCREPRGIAFSSERGELVVACQAGQVVALPVSGGEPLPLANLGYDLRDVAVADSKLLVTRFRRAEVLSLGSDGELLETLRPETVYPPGFVANADGSFPGAPGVFEPTLALGLHVADSGHVIMPHQRANRGRLAGAYYPMLGCNGGIAHSAVSVLSPESGQFVGYGVLPLGFVSDFAVRADETEFAVLTTHVGFSRVHRGDFATRAEQGNCGASEMESTTIPGQATAAAFTPEGGLLVQSREPAALHVFGGVSIPLSDESRADTGQLLFHMSTSLGVACATCHREGRDDGITYDFEEFGLRRTQVLAGGIASTAPYHWQGERIDFTAVLTDTFTHRMAGGTPSAEQAEAALTWLNTLPPGAPAAVVDTEAARRGANDFTELGCVTCHGGAMFTDGVTWDVGSGGFYQTPSLVGLASRAPYMHSGCATTIRDRFTPECGGTAHGDLSALGPEQLDDLVAFLESL